MGALIHLVKKESLVLVRDWHALLLLFAMPVLFILVMSLALRDRFAAQQGAALTYYLRNLDSHALSADVEVKVLAEENFRRLSSDEGAEALRERVARDEAHFLVLIPEGFGAAIDLPEPLAVQVLSGPGVDPATAKLFEAGVRGVVTRIYTERSIEKLQSSFPPRPGAPGPGGDSTPGTAAPQVNLDAAEQLVRRATAGRGVAEESAAVPTAVQQSVPAWLVFAMFFIAIPLSTTWVQERHQGTFARLRAMGLSRGALLFGKLVPYYVINLLQVVLMLAVGVWLVPLCGGDALTLGDSTTGLVVMAAALSFASVSYALLVANVVTTSEQATIFTGVSNLLLAALGGIMVPRFVMPAAMQEISLYSPMAWGLEGFLDIFLRHGGLAAVGDEVLKLAAFGAASLLLAALCLGRARGK
ncbi:MAG: ABC transporter permease [Planctomycetes bacterium]|nr:ABC transporter permease [Planctomycetota bacterium]